MRIFETERTFIDTVELSDAKFYLELLNTPGWLRFIGDRNVRNVDDAERFLKTGLLRTYQEKGYGYYLIRTKNGNDVGTCGFMKKDYLDHEDFGFALLPQYHGQGYALEACTCVLEFGLEQLALKVVDAVTDPENKRSISLLKKLGFKYAGNVYTGEENTELDLYQMHASG